jgi:hypothetical protein
VRAAALALAVAGGLSACRTPAARGPGGPAALGLAVTIDQPAAGGGAVARVDDRRALEVPARGTLDVDGVAPGLALDSVVLDAIARPGALRVERCALLDHAQAFAGGWIVGRAIEVTTAGGARLAGTVVEVEAVAVIALGGGEVELSLAELAAGAASATPALGDEVTVPTPLGDQLGTLERIDLHSLALHDQAGVRQAIRFDAIAILRVPELPAAPTLRCEVRTARPGRQAVRLAYRAAGASFQAGYQIAAVDDATTAIALAPRYDVELAGVGAPGQAVDVTLRALPADERGEPPMVLWRGPLAAGPGPRTAIGVPSTRAAQVRRLYRGAEVGDDSRARDWNADSIAAVWRELAFERAATDLPGPLRIATADGGVTVWHAGELAAAPAGTRLVRVPLAIDRALIGYRERVLHDDELGLADEVRFSVANLGPAPVRVIVEEPLRDLGRPDVRFAAPAVGTLAARVWQLELEVAPGAIERAAVLLQYPPP